MMPRTIEHAAAEPPRECGDCHACCIDLRIDQKPPGTRCEYLATPGGCSIYPQRPKLCRDYDCLWRLMGAGLLDDDQRPDRIGCVLTVKRASSLELPPRHGGDWLVAVAYPAGGREAVADRPEAMEAVRRVRMAGLHVLIDEPLAAGHLATLDAPLRAPTDRFVRTLALAMNSMKTEGP